MKTIIISILILLSVESQAQKSVAIISQDGTLYQIDTSKTTLKVLPPLVAVESAGGDTITISLKPFAANPSQKAALNQKSFVFKDVPASYGDYWIFKTIVPTTPGKPYLMYLMQPLKDYTTLGNTITFKSISLGSIIDFRQIR